MEQLGSGRWLGLMRGSKLRWQVCLFLGWWRGSTIVKWSPPIELEPGSTGIMDDDTVDYETCGWWLRIGPGLECHVCC